MDFFTQTFSELPGCRRLFEALDAGETPLRVTGLSAVHKAQLALTVSAREKKPVLLLTGTESEALKLCDDINAMAGETLAMHYPAKEMLYTPAEGKSNTYEHERLRVLSALVEGRIKIVAAGAEAAMQPAIPPKVLKDARITLKKGGAVDTAALAKALVEAGYTRCETVEGPGQFAVRGAIVDIFPVQEAMPLRMELWGDEVDTLHYFDPDTQRRTEALETLTVYPAMEILADAKTLQDKIEVFSSRLRVRNKDKIREKLAADTERLASGLPLANMDKYYTLVYHPEYLTSYLKGLVLVSEMADVRRQAKGIASQFREDLNLLLEDGTLCRGLEGCMLDCDGLFERISERPCVCLSQFPRGEEHMPFQALISVEAEQNALWGGGLQQLLEDLQPYIEEKYRVVLAARSEKTLSILANDLQESGVSCALANETTVCAPGQVLVTARSLSAGFAYPENKTALIVQTGLQASRKHRARHKAGTELGSLDDLHEGDLVVHSLHGVGRFLGIHKVEVEGIAKDYITIQYAGTDKLYVPVTQMDMVSRYVGTGDDSQVRLNKLSSPQWKKTCGNVRRAVKDMAEELTRLYAVREKSEGIAFEPDDELQREFESRFPYVETDDQLQSVEEIKADMERPRPMDRLLCGDVGFGKTEVAFRAAMKCVLSGRQCAILAPTTVLALQHYRTALQRFDKMPVVIEMLSRFRTPKEQKKILEDTEKGKIDILIGTHRIVSKDVKFRALGLAVVDEEQRFGVSHKERFKEMFPGIDVLTLSATPIPRTLNMALSGIRDMSVLSEPPQDRYPVQTYVAEYQEGLVAQAIARELKRGGQVYYIHNRIETILLCAAKIQEMAPEARIAVAHGKLSEEEISDIWQQVVEGEVDILVCTTIIETGVDVGNVNTLIIEDADRMGLSQLYQLRGRVGRSNRRAYAYFLFRKDKVLGEEAARRLDAMREFTQFGSGFRIAVRDLEIRGAGSILGGKQHGHMETVGYDLYMQMLGEALAEARGEKVPAAANCTVDIQTEAYIPESYIRDASTRIAIYRKIAAVRDASDASDLMEELVDRFGDPPKAVLGLVRVAHLRNQAAGLGITEIAQQPGGLMFYIKSPEPAQIAALSARYGRRILYSCTDKPYIGVKLLPKQDTSDLMREVLDTMTEAIA